MLQILGATAPGAAMLACGGRPDVYDDGTPSDPDPATFSQPIDPSPSDGGTDHGPADTFPLGSFTIRGAGRAAVIIGHDAGGLFAMTGACSHAGCKLQPREADNEWYCNCHNGHFEYDGAVKKVPRSVALVHFSLTLKDGNVFVDPAVLVDPATRVRS